MKINEIPKEYQDRVKFACQVCRNKFKAETGKNTDCAWKVCGGEICVYVEEAINQAEQQKLSLDDLCVACGKYAGEGRQICKECEDKTHADK